MISGELEKQIASFPTSVGGLIVSKTDHLAQEDALRINWTQGDETRYQPSNQGDYFRISTIEPDDISRQSNGWKEYMISLKDFENLGIEMSNITSAFLVKAKTGIDIGLSNIRLE